MDLLKVHANLLPPSLLLQNSCYRVTIRLATHPKTHPLYEPLRRAAKTYVGSHRSSLHKPTHHFDIAPNAIETLIPSRCSPTSMNLWTTHIAGTKEEAIMEHEQLDELIQVYSDGSGYKGNIGAVAVLFRAGKPPRTLCYHLGTDKEHMVFEAEERMLTLAEQQTGDLRCFRDSDYLLPCAFVDTFAGEVRPRSSIPHEDPTPGIDDHLPVSSDTSDSIAADCSKNWKAATSDEKKRMWSIFDETGIFVSTCRHGFILWYADMANSYVNSAKYPLTIIAKVLELLSERSLGAYDIGCGFSSTVMASSLGPLFKNMDCCLCVDAFHGFAHNYRCQTKHHPLWIDGAGLEDFGTIEHIFSASNALSPVIQYASAYNRHVFLDMFFKQWDNEKYTNLAMMIYNNYCQALQIISKELVALTEAMASLGITEEDFTLWRQEEVEYFHTLELQSQCSAVSLRFILSAPANYQFQPPTQGSYTAELSQTHKLETQRRYASEKLDAIQLELVAMEVKMGITHRWEPSSPEYQATIKYMCTREYHRAMDNLQRLVIQRLFELQRLNVAQTAPRLLLEWAKVSHYQFLDEFMLLHETRQDIHDKPWAKLAIRETMRQHLRIQWAREEVVRCNVEIRRIHTAIIDEDHHFSRILKDLDDTGSPLLVAAHDFCQRQCLVNAQVLKRI
ncbi:uncharacterized protein F5891DRAFT_1191479 [Suillus fuscotomentosus]|uniref:Uncharacterized protein n=1 Tax=Suillus fuscotomentosus TaxID=1912939 RepID=A0AAD4HHI4_9AGAM|nr:uncharacterized protein F5891DRAFT_1191479 [Suillus fuscotomentosus]KAG1897855.1 hypothetical protein F5891DRAFT_1191479 [Suillus fuscotomentosus]